MPSLAGCEVYRGTVWLSGESAGDLWPLSSLRVVEGVLAAGSLLETLDGLECLERVGTLHFVLASLRDISGLRNLVAVGDIEGRPDAMGSLFIGSAENLSSLEGLENVASARELNISGNPLLTSLEGLSGLERLDGGITIQENPLLEDLSGLDNLHDFDGDLWIYRSDNLRSLHGLEQIETIRYLYIVENPVLDDLDGLAGLQRVTSGIKLVDNPMLSPDEIEAFLARIEVEGEVILE
jgi:hypothetical protein